jgi:hypothetical protein
MGGLEQGFSMPSERIVAESDVRLFGHLISMQILEIAERESDVG